MLPRPICDRCGAPIKQPARGRTRIYCSEACRSSAYRARHAAPIGRLDSYLEIEREVEATLAALPDEMLGLPADADEAVLETVSFGWLLVLRFGRCATRARTPLGWRCEKAAEEMAQVLRRRFQA
jgi:hypothetical protein